MEILSFTLVIISSLTHALWNLLAKQSGEKNIFLGLSKIAEVIIFFIPFLIVVNRSGFDLTFWYFSVIAAGFVFLNYFLLAQAYSRIDLSVAYPISRSSTLFLPLIAFIVIGETIDSAGWIAVLFILGGVMVMYLDDLSIGSKRLFTNPGLFIALLAAFTVACYTVWDKMAVQHIHPFVYFYSYTFLTAIFYGLLMLKKFRISRIIREWKQRRFSILSVGFLNTFTYLLILTALLLSKATYVGALRQISLVFGVLFGWWILHERLTVKRICGAAFIITGSLLTLFAE